VVTVSVPLRAPDGTVALIREALATVKLAETPPPKRTDVAPVRFEPLIATTAPTGPDVGEIDEIVGAAAAAVTVNDPELVPVPAAVVTAIVPEVAPVGTVAVSCASELTVNVAAVPLNFTDDAPVKPEPLTVTDVPGEPLVGVNPLTAGAACTVEHPGSWNDPIRVCQLSSAFVVGCAS